MQLHAKPPTQRCPREGCGGRIFGEQSLAVEDRGRIVWTCLGCSREVEAPAVAPDLSGVPKWLREGNNDNDGARYWEPKTW